MKEPADIRDWMAFNAPVAAITPQAIKKAEEAGLLDQFFLLDSQMRYRYADAALKARGNPVFQIDHPKWAKWAARDEDGRARYFEHEPFAFGGCWDIKRGRAAWIPEAHAVWLSTDWKNSKVRVQ